MERLLPEPCVCQTTPALRLPFSVDGQSGAFHGFIDGMILVISRHLFHGLNLGKPGFSIYLFVFFKDDEVADQIKQGGFIKHALDQHFKLAGDGQTDSLLAVDGFPGLKTAEGRGNSAGSGFQAIRNYAKSIVEKERRNHRFVGLYLVVGFADGGLGFGRDF